MPQVDFVNHHVHSHFSTLDGLSSPQEIVQRIVDLGQKSVSVTDHGSMSAIPSMYKAAKDAGIGFTPGCEMYFATDRTYKAPDKIGEKYYHLILLANNNEGYRNLLKMQTVAWEDGYYYKPRIDYDVLDKYHKGITVTTSCLGGIVNQYLLRGDVKSAEREVSTLIDIFGKDNVYVELQNHGIKDQLKILGDQRDLAQRFDLKMIATTDSHYCTEDESDIHDSLLCTGTRAKKTDEKRFRFESDQNFLQSGKKMLELFPEEDFPGAISNTVELAEKTEFSMNMGDNKKYLMPAGHYGEKSDVEVLRERVYAGAQDMKRYGDENGDIPEEVSKRIDYELSVIEKMQFSSYFLIMENIISLLARNGIHTGPGRGCVTAGTVVKTSAGEKSIEDMTIGDKVLTHTGEIKKVLNTMEYGTGEGEELIRISATHSGSTSYVTTTQKHLVYAVPSENALGLKSGLYVPGKIGYQTPQWIPSSHIKVGDFIAEPVEFLSCGYVYRKVSDIEKVSNVEKVYDITVEDDNSYVTSIGAIHNSAPGSVVVYCLGIVDVDPLEHGLLFERFLNPDRISMPDIDVDIPKSKRQKALELVEEEYGKGHVAHLSNYSKMGMRDSLLRAAKVYGLSPGDANKFRDEIATWCEDYGESLVDFAKRGKAPKEIEKKIISTPHYNSIVKTAAKFIGRIMSYGVHASGILITDTPLDDNFPLRKSDKTQLPVCQFDGTDTESIGGVKFDLLGLINLDECEDTERNILLDLGEEVDSSDLVYDDEEVYNMLSHGNGGGVFQLGCVTGDTIVDGQRIDMMYSLRNSDLSTKEARSLFFGRGYIGNHCVDKVVFSGVKDTIKVSTSHHSITCTPEHHIWTKQGWVKAGDLTDDDYILTVKDDFTYASGVRGLEDIIDLYLSLNPGWERYPGKNPVNVDGLTYYPHVINDKWDRYVCFYPDEAYSTGVKAEEKAQARNDNGDKIVTIMSYGQMVETYVHETTSHDHIISPVGTTWEKVESIEDNGKEKTYDLMMDYPVNNFIANGIVTHNSSGIQSLLRHMQPSEFKHIPAILALYRPGPMGMGTHDEYCERRLGQHESVAMHHDMEEVLGENYNLIIYQEDIMHIARLMAGYTGGEADDLRKAMAKKDPQKMEKHKKKFIPEVNKRYGGKLGNELWDVIEPFGAYAFNRSHSVAYGMITYRTAWLKAHYPAQFSGAVIDQRMSNPDDVFETVSWIKREGIGVYAPDVQRSEMRSVTTSDSIYLPLHIIKGMGAKKAEEIIDERNANGPFKTVVDFAARCKLSKSMIINMAKAGAFDSMGANRAAVISKAEEIIDASKSHKSVMDLKQGLFGSMISSSHKGHEVDVSEDPIIITVDGEDIEVDDTIRSQWERDIMGVLIGTHPFETLRDEPYFQNMFTIYPPIDEYTQSSRNAQFCGYIYNISNRVSGKGNPYCSFMIETDRASVPALRFKEPIDESHEGAFIKVEGSIENDANGEGEDFTPKAICNKIIKVDVKKRLNNDKE